MPSDSTAIQARTVFRQDTAPADSAALWLDTNTTPPTLKQFNSNSANWEPVASSSLSVQNTTPTGAVDGDLWSDTSKTPPELNVYDTSTGRFIPPNSKTIVSQTKPTPEVGKIWFEPAQFGTNMYAASSSRWEFLKFLSAIPDSQVTISMPSNGSGTTPDVGGVIQTSQEWDKFQARFDDNTNLASDEELVLEDGNGNELEVIDASNATPGDIFTFSTSLSANAEYRIYGRTPNNNGRNEAFNDSVSFPITSSDGNLEVTAGYASNKTNNKRTDLIQHISGYGNFTL